MTDEKDLTATTVCRMNITRKYSRIMHYRTIHEPKHVRITTYQKWLILATVEHGIYHGFIRSILGGLARKNVQEGKLRAGTGNGFRGWQVTHRIILRVQQ